MISDKKLLKSDYDKLRFVRWLLLLIAAAEASGLKSLTRSRIHSLLFLSFSAAPFYDLKPLRQRVKKTKQGPYYRAAHLTLGYLTFADFLVVEEFEPYFSQKDLQFDGRFEITQAGLVASHKLRESHYGGRLYKFLLDLCLATSQVISQELEFDDEDLEGKMLDKILEQDLTYRQALKKIGDIIRLEDMDQDFNPTVKGLNVIDEYLKVRKFINRKDVLSAYQVLLRERAEVA